jgi:hypothetical protein
MEDLYQEFEDVGLRLERWHGIFYELWDVGIPNFTKAIPTAAVAWNKRTLQIEFLFNPDFWKILSDYEKEFVICHEMIHVIYEHLKRMKDCKDQKIANVAADIIVNHKLVDDFGFVREDLGIGESLIWIDKVFPDDLSVERDREFEYYYNLIKDNNLDANQQTLDQHGVGSGEEEQADGPGGSGDAKGNQGLGPEYSDIPDEVLDDVIEEAAERLSDAEKETFSNIAGTSPGSLIHRIKKKRLKLKRRWEDIVQVWTAKGEDEDDNWTRKARRHFLLTPEFILPAMHDQEDKNRINLWWFQDTSGSCANFADHFFNAAKTFPENSFDVKMFGFDTRVYKIDGKNLRGFGGTAFSPIEEYIQDKTKREGLSYPDAVFVFTDGCGDHVIPQYPERWYWFLEGSYQNKNCIPKKSKIFQLSDFVA